MIIYLAKNVHDVLEAVAHTTYAHYARLIILERAQPDATALQERVNFGPDNDRFKLENKHRCLVFRKHMYPWNPCANPVTTPVWLVRVVRLPDA